jgi:predicted DCC family thiol-disulfide oxidoreductase YuxK
MQAINQNDKYLAISAHHPVILFDGVCLLCNYVVKFLIKHDKKAIFKFGVLQDADQLSLTKSREDLSSVVLMHRGQVLEKSIAVVNILKLLGGKYKYFAWVFNLIPVRCADKLYSFIADNRYKWFGKLDTCMVPDDTITQRFII